MARKRFTSEQIITMLREAEVDLLPKCGRIYLTRIEDSSKLGRILMAR